jgi:hypothetical protein
MHYRILYCNKYSFDFCVFTEFYFDKIVFPFCILKRLTILNLILFFMKLSQPIQKIECDKENKLVHDYLLTSDDGKISKLGT